MTLPGRTLSAGEGRWDAASGFVVLLLGVAGAALERGWPSAADPVAVSQFIEAHRPAILGQSMAFVLSAGIYMWFFASLRAFLARAEGDALRLSPLVYGAGLVWVGLQMTAQAFQVGVAMAPAGTVQSSMLWIMAAMFSISNLPLAIALLATALVTFRTKAFPAWLGVIALAASLAQFVLWLGTVARSGPLSGNGWLTYTLYPMVAVWLLPTTIVMMKRAGNSNDPRAR